MGSALRGDERFRVRDLVAQLVQDVGGRPAKDQASLAAGPGQCGVLRQKAISRVNGVNAVLPGDVDDSFDAEIRPDRLAGAPYLIGLVGLKLMQRVTILVRIDRHGSNAELVSRTKDANRDFTSIGNQ